jgi:hypothetical protein
MIDNFNEDEQEWFQRTEDTSPVKKMKELKQR